MGHFLRSIVKKVFVFVIFIVLGISAFADGSQNLYPSGVSGNRASLQIRSTGSAGYDPFPTSGTMWVYLKEGETLYVGSSAQGKKSTTTTVYTGTINMWSPNGVAYTSGSSTTVGLIANRTEELAGPKTPTNTGGYLPYTHIVTAAEVGIWKVEFLAASDPAPGGITGYGPILANSDWTQPTASSSDQDRSLIVAFDVSVGSAADAATIIPGRLYCNTLNLNMPFNQPGLSTTIYVLTNVGYVFQVGTSDLVGGGFNFFSNSKGIKNGTDPSFLSETYVSGNSYGNTLSGILSNISDPRALDSDTDITHKIFFTKPSADMPETANQYSGSTIPNTVWLRKSINTLPTIGGLTIKGVESGEVGIFGPDGANVYFNSNVQGKYKVVLKFGGSFTDRILEGDCNQGENNVLWDGKDGAGTSITQNTTITVVGTFTAAEVHFPFCDVEYNGNGMKLELLNPTTSTLDLYSPTKDIVYWDDSKITNTTGVPTPTINNNSGSGIPSTSNGHKYGSTDLYSSFGNESILDTWSYIPSNEMTTTGLTFSTKKLDLAVNSISPNVTTAYVGNSVTYTVVVENITNAGANATENAVGAKFGFEAPAGFAITGHTFTLTSGTGSESNFSATGSNIFTSDFDLTNGGKITYTITGTVGVGLAHGIMTPRAYVIRPSDIIDIDATSGVAGTPNDPDLECNGGTSGVGCNNIKTATSVVTILNTAPVAIDDTKTIDEDNTATDNVVTNDTDVDLDALTVTSFNVDTDGNTSQESFSAGATATITGVGTIEILSTGAYTFIPVTNYNGTVPTVTYTISDGHTGTDDGTLIITVTPVNDDFTDANENISVNEDSGATTGTLLTGTSSVDGTVTVASFSIAGETGTFTLGSAYTITGKGDITINSDGTYSFTPVANYNGSIPVVTYILTDGTGTDETSILTISVTAVNDDFTDAEETTSVSEDSGANIGTLLTGTSSVDGTVTVASFSIAGETGTFTLGSAYTITGKGDITINSDGTYSFTPVANYNGSIPVVTYILTDGTGTDETSILTISVTAVNDDFTDAEETTSVSEDSGANIGTLLTGTSSVDGTVTVASFSIAGETGTFTLGSAYTITGKGDITINSDGTYSFTPVANYNGSIPVISYTLTDGTGTDETSTLTISVTSVNDDFTDADETISVSEDSGANNGTLLTGTSSVDGTVSVASFSIAGETGPFALNTPYSITGKGSITIDSDGSYSFTPVANYNGSIPVISYTLTDGTGTDETSTLTISVTAVNDDFTDADETISVSEDSGANNGTLLTGTSSVDGTVSVASFSIAGETGPFALNTPYSITGKGSITIDSDGSYSFTPVANYNGSIPVISYTLTDGTGTDETSTLTISVTSVNDDFTDADETISVSEDSGATTGTLLTGTSSVDGTVTVASFSIAGETGTFTLGSAHTITGKGDITINSDGTYSFTPVANYNGSIPVISYTLTDGSGTDETSTLTITINGANDAPVAENDIATVNEDGVLHGATLLGNDGDVDGNILTINTISVSGPSNGVLTINADGTYVYTPDKDYKGGDSFVYEVCDNGSPALCDQAMVTITINSVNDAPTTVSDNYSVAEGGTLILPASGVLSNDTDPENDPLTAILVSTTTNGTLMLNADGSFTYIHDGSQTTSDAFTYKVNDGSIDGNIVTVTIDVTPENDAPIASDDNYSVGKSLTLNVLASGVLFNDKDFDGNSITSILVTSTTHGSLTLNANGSFVYIHDGSENLSDSFTYKVNDGTVDGNTATVTISINTITDLPIANADNATVNEDNTLNGLSVIDNDNANGEGPLTVVANTNPAHGVLTMNANGTYTYLPNANFNGTDSFTYTVSDINGDESTATVTIDILPVNDLPLAVNDAATVSEDNVLNGLSVLSNDKDNNEGPLAIVSHTNTSNGTLVLSADGTYVYTPNANYSGIDAFTYTIRDANGDLSLATVTLTVDEVNDTPLATNDVATISEGTSLNGTSVLTNDNAKGEGPLSIVSHTNPTNGILTLNADGTYTYVPNQYFNGTDSFTYTISDKNGDESTATVTINVSSVNTIPLAVNNVATVVEDGVLNGTTVLTNDDAKGEGPLTIVSNTNPSHGILVLNVDGTYTYTPTANYSGSDNFTYTVQDNNGDQSTATVTISVTSVNDLPVATVDAVTLSMNTTYNGSSVLLNDIANGEGPLTVVGNTNPLNGTLTMNSDGTYRYVPTTGYLGGDSFTYTIQDNNGDQSIATVNLTVIPIGALPVAVNDIASVNENVTLNGTSVLSNDDAHGDDPLTIVSNTNPTNGLLTLNVDGTYTYTPTANFSGTDEFTYTIQDKDGETATASVIITVVAVDDTPVAVNDAVSINEDNTLNGTSLLVNDQDKNEGPLTVVSNTNPAHGLVTVNVDGTYIYIPNANFSGNDSFSYTIDDADGDQSTATVNITVNAVNDIPLTVDDVVTITEDQVLNGTTVLANDNAKGEGPLTVVSNTDPAHGTLIMNNNGTYTYSPNADYNGTDMFTYTVRDNNGDESTATVTITINNIDETPIAKNDAASVSEDNVLNGQSVLANDNDNGEGPLTILSHTNTLNGTLVLNADGTYTYTPNADYFGTDSFTYTVSDNDGDQATATVSITVNPVNDVPLAVNDNAIAIEDQIFAGTTLFVNDLVKNEGPIALVSYTQPANGTVTVNADGTYSYMPNANFNGIDLFTYIIVDNNGDVSTASVSVTVTPVNDAPVANADVVSVNEDGVLNGTTLLANDNDLDGDALTINTVPVSGPTNGTLTINADGTYTYTPNANYKGGDSFVYEVCDNGTPVLCAQATVTITVNSANDAPVAVNDVASVNEKVQYNGTSLLGNDTDIDGDQLTITAIRIGSESGTGTSGTVGTAMTGSYGTLTLESNGSYSYLTDALKLGVMKPGETKTEVFAYTVGDGHGGFDMAELTITIDGVNDIPVAVNDAGTVEEDATLTVSQDNGLIYNATTGDRDADGDLLTVTAIRTGKETGTGTAGTVGVALIGTYGKLTIAANGSYIYYADQHAADALLVGQSITETFTYTVSDGKGGTDLAELVITILGMNEYPVLVDDIAQVDEDGILIGSNLLANDSDPDGNILTINTIPASYPSHGTLVIYTDGTYKYTPNSNYTGPDHFQYEVCDNGLPQMCNQADVTITVVPVNDPPVAVNDNARVDENGVLNGSSLLANDTDIDGNSLIINTTPLSNPSHGTLTINANGTYTYKPNADYQGTDSFTYEVCDNGVPKKCSQATVTINVDNLNSAPVAVNDVATTEKGVQIILNPLANDYDTDGLINPTTVQIVGVPSNGVVTVNSVTGTITYTPNPSFVGVETFTYLVSDNEGLKSNIATITVNVTAPVNKDDDGDGVTNEREITDGTNPSDGCDFLLASVTLETSSAWKSSDCDSDGLTNGKEIGEGPDTDTDGKPNFLDTDDDGDGTNTKDEDTNGDGNFSNDDCNSNGVPNYLDPVDCSTLDTDGDGVTNNKEITDGTNPSDGCDFLLASVTLEPSSAWKSSDCDSDGLTNGKEIGEGPDTDTDGKPNFLDTDDDGDGTATKDEDTNGDGNFSNDDCNSNGIADYLDPVDCSTLDTDGDGVTNNKEITDGTNPSDGCDFLLASVTLEPSSAWKSSDCDSDGLTNGKEIGQGPDSDTDGKPNFLDPDDDGDGTNTKDEDTNGDGSFGNDDCNSNGVPNYLDPVDCSTLDTDGDGVTNNKEITDGTNPSDGCDFLLASVTLEPSSAWKSSDCDSDGLTNGKEIGEGPDTDTDGKPNFLDTDDDGDGTNTKDEDTNNDGNFSNDDCNSNGVPNYLDPVDCSTIDDDGDGVTNEREITDGTNPSDGCDFLISSSSMLKSASWQAGDCDLDGVLNGTEYGNGQDSDADGNPDFLDPDDDGDGVLTINEDVDENGSSLNDDTDGDSIPNYLDDDDDGDKILTLSELRDLNENDIVDYLEITAIQVVDDSANTGMEIDVTISVLDNDKNIFGDGDIVIVQNPTNGGITVDQETGVITYTPNDGFVGVDSIIYSICNVYNECGQATVTISVDDLISPPTAFTPNGNGQNDYYVIRNLENYSKSHLTIMNRWGSIVFESNDYKNEWDGYANTGILIGSDPLPVGTYFYVLKYGTNKAKTGFIYLKR